MYQGTGQQLAEPIRAVKELGLMQSVCSAFALPGTTDPLGQVDFTDLVPVSGLQNVVCMFSASMPARVDMGAVIRGEQNFDTMSNRHVLLDGYYPAWQQNFIAQVDGDLYEVMGIDSDSQHTQTRLAVRAYSL